MVELDPPPIHLKWLVKSRFENQQVALKLFTLLKNHPDKVSEAQMSSEAQALVAIAFSLWRAAFLADKTGARGQTAIHAMVFLEKMLADNAITYVQDRNSREWTFNYYINNARYRLEELGKTWPSIVKISLILPAGKRTPKNRWNRLQAAFSIAVDSFEKELMAI